MYAKFTTRTSSSVIAKSETARVTYDAFVIGKFYVSAHRGAMCRYAYARLASKQE